MWTLCLVPFFKLSSESARTRFRLFNERKMSGLRGSKFPLFSYFLFREIIPDLETSNFLQRLPSITWHASRLECTEVTQTLATFRETFVKVAFQEKVEKDTRRKQKEMECQEKEFFATTSHAKTKKKILPVQIFGKLLRIWKCWLKHARHSSLSILNPEINKTTLFTSIWA